MRSPLTCVLAPRQGRAKQLTGTSSMGARPASPVATSPPARASQRISLPSALREPTQSARESAEQSSRPPRESPEPLCDPAKGSEEQLSDPARGNTDQPTHSDRRNQEQPGCPTRGSAEQLSHSARGKPDGSRHAGRGTTEQARHLAGGRPEQPSHLARGSTEHPSRPASGHPEQHGVPVRRSRYPPGPAVRAEQPSHPARGSAEFASVPATLEPQPGRRSGERTEVTWSPEDPPAPRDDAQASGKSPRRRTEIKWSPPPPRDAAQASDKSPRGSAEIAWSPPAARDDAQTSDKSPSTEVKGLRCMPRHGAPTLDQSHRGRTEPARYSSTPKVARCLSTPRDAKGDARGSSLGGARGSDGSQRGRAEPARSGFTRVGEQQASGDSGREITQWSIDLSVLTDEGETSDDSPRESTDTARSPSVPRDAARTPDQSPSESSEWEFIPPVPTKEAETSDRARRESAECRLSPPTRTGNTRARDEPCVNGIGSPDGPEDQHVENPGLQRATRGTDPIAITHAKLVAPSGALISLPATAGAYPLAATPAKLATPSGGLIPLPPTVGADPLAATPAKLATPSGGVTPLPATLGAEFGKRTVLSGGLLTLPPKKRRRVLPHGKQRGVAVPARQSVESAVGGDERKNLARPSSFWPVGDYAGGIRARPPILRPASDDGHRAPVCPPVPPVSGGEGGTWRGPPAFPQASSDACGVSARGPVLGKRTASRPGQAFLHKKPARVWDGSSTVRATARLELALSDGSDADESQPPIGDRGGLLAKPPDFPPMGGDASEVPARPPVLPHVGGDAGGTPARRAVLARAGCDSGEHLLGECVETHIMTLSEGSNAEERQPVSRDGGRVLARPPGFPPVAGDASEVPASPPHLPPVGGDAVGTPASRAVLVRPGCDGGEHPPAACVKTHIMSLSVWSDADEVQPVSRDGSGGLARPPVFPPVSGDAGGILARPPVLEPASCDRGGLPAAVCGETHSSVPVRVAPPALTLAEIVLQVVENDIPPMSTRTFIEVMILLLCNFCFCVVMSRSCCNLWLYILR